MVDFTQIKKDIKNRFYRDSMSHDWDHVERVCRLCCHIGEKEDADLQVLELAALLHDIGREEERGSKGRVCHAEIGALKAEVFLSQYRVAPGIASQVVYCIKTHRFRGSNKPETLEARVLFDADKLDAIGAIGIGRAFLFAGEIGARVHNNEVDISKTLAYSIEDTAYREFICKLQNIKDMMQTGEGKKIAGGRHDFMMQFFQRLNREVEGLC